MFSKDITNSSEFMMMSQTAQALYFHLGMNGDDDGFCEVYTVMRMTDSKPDDLRTLHEKGFIFAIDSRVAIIKDWHEHNQMRGDRYKPSKYLSDPNFASIYATIMKEKIQSLSQYSSLATNWQPNGNHLVPQDSIGEDRVGKNCEDKSSPLQRIEEVRVNNEGEIIQPKVRYKRKGTPAAALMPKLYAIVKRERGVEPTPGVADYMRVDAAFKAGLTEKDIVTMVEDAFENGSTKRFVTVSNVFTRQEIDRYKQENV